MKAEYLRPGFDFALAHAVEEAGEFLAAAGKTQRWGRLSVNPELPREQQETNAEWLRREMRDLNGALDRLNEAMRQDPASPLSPHQGGVQMKLTPEFVAMSPLQKWETLVLNGLVGTDEPWIDDLRNSLRAQAAQLDLYEAALREIALGAVGGNPDEPFSGYMCCRKVALTALNPTDTGA